jgi:diadenosine tetraphosphate (Ap4A) HIT family hydrolase
LSGAKSPLGVAASPVACVLCRGTSGDLELERVQVWKDDLWRLTMSSGGEIAGFSYLGPRRPVPCITDLEGAEARTLGPVLALVTRALKAATGSEVIYVYIFGGGIPHLHIHPAPHRRGDALNDRVIRGEVAETPIPSGATSIVSKEFPPLPAQAHADIRERLHHLLGGSRRAL